MITAQRAKILIWSKRQNKVLYETVPGYCISGFLCGPFWGFINFEQYSPRPCQFNKFFKTFSKLLTVTDLTHFTDWSHVLSMLTQSALCSPFPLCPLCRTPYSQFRFLVWKYKSEEPVMIFCTSTFSLTMDCQTIWCSLLERMSTFLTYHWYIMCLYIYAYMHMHYAYAYAIAKEATNQYVEFFFPVSFVVLPIFSFLVQIGLEIYLVALGEPQFRGDLFSRNFKCPARCRCSKTKDFVHISSVFINSFYNQIQNLKYSLKY